MAGEGLCGSIKLRDKGTGGYDTGCPEAFSGPVCIKGDGDEIPACGEGEVKGYTPHGDIDRYV